MMWLNVEGWSLRWRGSTKRRSFRPQHLHDSCAFSSIRSHCWSCSEAENILHHQALANVPFSSNYWGLVSHHQNKYLLEMKYPLFSWGEKYGTLKPSPDHVHGCVRSGGWETHLAHATGNAPTCAHSKGRGVSGFYVTRNSCAKGSWNHAIVWDRSFLRQSSHVQPDDVKWCRYMYIRCSIIVVYWKLIFGQFFLRIWTELIIGSGKRDWNYPVFNGKQPGFLQIIRWKIDFFVSIILDLGIFIPKTQGCRTKLSFRFV